MLSQVFDTFNTVLKRLSPLLMKQFANQEIWAENVCSHQNSHALARDTPRRTDGWTNRLRSLVIVAKYKMPLSGAENMYQDFDFVNSIFVVQFYTMYCLNCMEKNPELTGGRSEFVAVTSTRFTC